MAWLLPLFLDVVGLVRLGGVRVNLFEDDGNKASRECRAENDR